VESPERRIDVIEARAMLQVEQAIDIRFRDPDAPGKLCLANAGPEPFAVKQSLRRFESRQTHQPVPGAAPLLNPRKRFLLPNTIGNQNV
jgi:hypothetical protein